MFRFLIPALLITLMPFAARAESCDIRPAATALDAALRDLQALPKDDGMETDESLRAQAAIVAVKARIGSFVTASMSCTPEGVVAKTVQADLSRLGQVSFAVRRTEAGLIAVTANFGIECGSDTVLQIFARRDGAWREVLRDEAAPYKTVAGALDDYDYAISPPDAAGRWFVVATSVAPWCSSNWSTIRYRVLRPGAAKPIFSAEDSIFREDQDARLTAGVNYFDLRFAAESVDNAVFTREWVRRFSVVGDQVRRTAPLANRPRDFAEEWIVSPWKDARLWTKPGTALEGLHAELGHLKTGLEYIAIRKCGALTQIGFQPYDSDTRRYFLLVSGDRDFVMQNAARKPDPRCTGKNLYDPGKPN